MMASARSPKSLFSLCLTGLVVAIVSTSFTRTLWADEFLPLADEFVSNDGWTGDSIYRRMLENRFDSYEQEIRLRSGDEAGNFQEVELRLRYKNFRAQGKGEILSKSIAKYFSPQDVRHLGYLVLNKKTGPDDQFVYRPSSRKVRRINVRSESVAGTDFAFEDIVPPEFEDGRHYRKDDGKIDDRETFVVTVVPHALTESDYSKVEVEIDKELFVPLRTQYWDNKRVMVKRLDAETDSLVSVEGAMSREGETKVVWIAKRSKMTSARAGTYTGLVIARFEANPNLKSRHFSQRELTSSR